MDDNRMDDRSIYRLIVRILTWFGCAAIAAAVVLGVVGFGIHEKGDAALGETLLGVALGMGGMGLFLIVFEELADLLSVAVRAFARFAGRLGPGRDGE